PQWPSDTTAAGTGDDLYLPTSVTSTSAPARAHAHARPPNPPPVMTTRRGCIPTPRLAQLRPMVDRRCTRRLRWLQCATNGNTSDAAVGATTDTRMPLRSHCW